MRENTLGEVVAYYRNLRGLSQTELGNLLFKSRSWVQKLESGDRQADPRLGILEDISRVLVVSLEELLNMRADSRFAENAQKSELIERYINQISVAMFSPSTYFCDEVEYSLSRIKQGIEYAFAATQNSHVFTVCEMIPDLLEELNKFPKSYEKMAVMSRLYQLITFTLVRLGATSLGVISGERAFDAALENGDPYEIALACQAFVYSLSLDSKAAIGLELAESTLARVNDFLHKENAPGFAALGSLLLQSAISSSLLGVKYEASEFLKKAKIYGTMVRKTDYHYTNFGSTNVELHGFAMYSNLGMHGAAFKYESLLQTPDFAQLTVERKCHFFIDLADLYRQENNYQKAAALLMRTFQLSPQEVKVRPVARGLVHALKNQISGSHYTPRVSQFMEGLII